MLGRWLHQTDRTPPVAGDALFAATTVLGHLAGTSRHAEPQQLPKSEPPVARPVWADDASGPRLARSTAGAVAVAVIRWTTAGDVTTVDLALAADCDVWVRRGRHWSRHDVQDMFAPEGRAAIEFWDAANRHAPLRARFLAEREIIDDPVAWLCTAIGRFDEPKFKPLRLDPCFDELVIATDGADIPLLQGLGMCRLEQWARLSRVVGRFARRRGGRRFDDVAVVRMEVQPSDASYPSLGHVMLR